MTRGQQVTIIIASWCHMRHKLYQQHKDLGVWAQAFQHKEVCLNCHIAALAGTHSRSQGEIMFSEDIHAAHNRTENKTKKQPWRICACSFLCVTEETESYFPTASIKQSFSSGLKPALSIWIFKRTTVDPRSKEVRKDRGKVFFFLHFKTNELVDPHHRR